MMKSRVQCLLRVGENVKKHKLIVLDGKDEITIGRGTDVSVCLMSLRVSHRHAILKKTDKGAWTIKDNKSLNGVFINDVRLEPMKPRELQEGDMVSLGGDPPEFLYKYRRSVKVAHSRQADTVDGVPASKKQRKESSVTEAVGGSSKASVQAISDSLVSSSQPDFAERSSPSKSSNKTSEPTTSPYLQYREKLDQQAEEAKKKMEEFEAKLKEMQRLLKEKETEQQAMAKQLAEEKCKRVQEVETLQQKEDRLRQEFAKKQEQMAKEKEEMEARLKEELEDQLHVKEANLMESLEQQRLGLMNEKRKIEERLKEELESERERDKQLTEELLQQKKNLEKVIENKEVEKKLLESQLNDTKLEKDQKHEAMLRAREDVLANFAQLMETELQCSICNELFVKATSLNCSHAFCSLCINQWMKVKKECPQCRTAITTHMRSIVLDSYIDKMVEQFSEDMKKSRQEFVSERKNDEAAFEAANQPQPAAARGRGRRGRGRGRGGARRGNMDAPPPLPEAPPSFPVAPAIVISDNEEDSDDFHSLSESGSDIDLSDSLSEDEVSGDENAYFGGYGRCYNCGARGHWANGCPYR